MGLVYHTVFLPQQLTREQLNDLSSFLHKGKAQYCKNIDEPNFEKNLVYKKRVETIYLIPIKIGAPLIFVHLACAKIKASSCSTNARKSKGEEKMQRMNERNSKFTVK